MKTAIIWQRFGPYHLARLEGAALSMQDVCGIEVAGQDHYAWDSITSSPNVDRRTLFPDRNYDSLSKGAIRQAVGYELDRIQPDLVAINGWSVPEALSALDWCRKHGKRTILMSETFLPSSSRLKEWIKRQRVVKFDTALVGGHWHASYLVQLGFPRDKIFIGYDAVDNQHFLRGAEAALKESDHWRRKLELPERYFFANTRFLPRKNIDGLLRAFAALGSRVQDWHLVISGSGEMAQVWKKLGDKLGIGSRVYWPGFVQYEELPIYYGLASCFVHPAHSEAWGLVINEACAAGLPIIAGDRVGSTCELVRSGKNGWLVDSKNEEVLAGALEKMISAPSRLRQSMGNSSREIIADFGPHRFGKALAETT